LLTLVLHNISNIKACPDINSVWGHCGQYSL